MSDVASPNYTTRIEASLRVYQKIALIEEVNCLEVMYIEI